MEELSPAEVTQALSDWLGKVGKIDVSRDGPGGRITGWIMHPDFTGISRTTRQTWLWEGTGEAGNLPAWKGLRVEFGARSVEIGVILTYSPAEYENAFGSDAQTA